MRSTEADFRNDSGRGCIQRPETLSQRQDLYRKLRRILACNSANASHTFSRSRRFRIPVAYRWAATRATTRVRKFRNVSLALIPEQFGSRVLS